MVDTALAVANSPAAPVAERHDATVEAMASGGTLQKALQLDMIPVVDRIRDILEEQDFAKAMGRGMIQLPGPKRKAGPRGGQSVFLDEYQILSQGEWYDRPGILGFDSMRAMVEQTPILNAIMLTRQRQIMRFCRPAVNRDDVGFKIMHVDPTVELNDQQQESIKLLTKFVGNCGWETDPRRRKRMKRDNFSQFMVKQVRDSLIMDSAPIETEFKRDRALGIDGFYAIDGATIRLCKEEGYEGDDEIFALQVIQGQIRTAYNYDQLIYEVRNPRTDVTASGYGYSEAEMLIRIVTYLLNTMTYNGSFFDKNSIPRGMLNLVGNYDQNDLAAFKRYWNAMCKGIGNVHNLPVMVAKDGESKSEFVEIGGQLNEMAFGRWLTFLTSIACAVYGCAPEDISMESFAAEGKSSLSGSDTGEKLVSSNDKGLRPLLSHWENLMSDFVLQPFSDQYCLRFVGLDNESAEIRSQWQEKTQTWNEARIARGMDPVSDPLGDAPLNTVLASLWGQQRQVDQQAEQEDFGDGMDAQPDEAGDGDVDDDGAGDDVPPGQEPDFGSDDEKPVGGGPNLNKSLIGNDLFDFPLFRIEA